MSVIVTWQWYLTPSYTLVSVGDKRNDIIWIPSVCAPISSVVPGETCPLTGIHMTLSVVCKDSPLGSFKLLLYTCHQRDQGQAEANNWRGQSQGGPTLNIQLLPVCSIRTFRTYLKENQQELYIEGWPTLTLTPSFNVLSSLFYTWFYTHTYAGCVWCM